MLILRKMFVNTVLIILFVIAFTVEGQTTPLIKVINISFIQGGTVNITGSEFGTKNPVKPYLWADFNQGNLNPSSLGSKTAWDGNNLIVYEAGCGADGSGCARDNTINRPYPSQWAWALKVITTGEFNINDYSQKFYLYRNTKRNFSVASKNWKIFRAWASGLTLPDWYINQGNGSAGPEGCGTTYCWGNDTIDSTAANTNWMTEEIIFQANASAITRSNLKYYIDSVIHTNCPGDGVHYFGAVRSDSVGCTADMVDIYPLHGVMANESTVPIDSHYWADNIYMDTTWSRVMICAGSAWANRGHCEIQIPTVWSCSGSPEETCTINAVVNKGSFVDGNKVYLFVVDANNNNSNICPITIGKSGPIVCHLQ